MVGKTTKIVGAAGAVAAATAVGVAVARGRTRASATYHVRPGSKGWIVSKDGGGSPSTTHATKKEAVTAGRRLASRDAPSTLALYYADGRPQKRLTYDGKG